MQDFIQGFWAALSLTILPDLILRLGAENMAPKHPQSLVVTFGLANQRFYLEGDHLALFIKGHSSRHKEVFVHFHLEQPVVKR